jgi:hypothetical protein
MEGLRFVLSIIELSRPHAERYDDDDDDDNGGGGNDNDKCDMKHFVIHCHVISLLECYDIVIRFISFNCDY